MYLDPNTYKQGDLATQSNPSTEPVTVAEIKTHLRIDNSYEDALLGSYITAATEMAEAYCNRHFIEHEYKLYFNDVTSVASLIYPDCTLLDDATHDPVNWLDENGVWQSNSEAFVDANSNPSIAYLSSEFTSPKLKKDAANRFYYRFKTGMGASASDIPEAIKQAIKLIVSDMYYFREDRKRAFPMASEILLQPYKCYH